MTLNFFSALLGASGVCLFALNLLILLSPASPKAGEKINRHYLRIVCLIGSLSFACSKSYWSASLAAKGGIYVLQVALELGFLLALQLWIKKIGTQKIFALIFVFCLGFINHWPTQALLVPALLLSTFVRLEGWPVTFRHFQLKRAWFGLTIVSLVASLYLFLPLRSHLYPVLNFGAPFTFHRFIDSILRTDYAKVETMASYIPTALSTLQDKAIYISNHFLGEFNSGFLLLSIFGVVFFLKRGRKQDLLFLLLVLLTTLTANLLYLQVLPIEYWHLDDHLLTLNWSAALLSSAGLYHLLVNFHEKFSRWSNQKFPMAAGAFLLCLIPFFTLLDNFSANNQRKEFLFHGYGTGLLKSMEKNALYFAESDYDYFALLYLKEVERKRNDVGLINVPFLSKDYQYTLLQEKRLALRFAPASALQNEELLFQWLGGSLVNLPLYCAFPNGPFAEMFLRHNTSLVFRPEGLTIRVHPRQTASSARSSIMILDDFWIRHLMPPNRSTNPINGLFLELCAHPFLNTANYLKLRHDMLHWDSYYLQALNLIRDPRWRAETWANKAKIDLEDGKKRIAMEEYILSARNYKQSGMEIKANEMLGKALQINPSFFYNEDRDKMLFHK